MGSRLGGGAGDNNRSSSAGTKGNLAVVSSSSKDDQFEQSKMRLVFILRNLQDKAPIQFREGHLKTVFAEDCLHSYRRPDSDN